MRVLGVLCALFSALPVQPSFAESKESVDSFYEAFAEAWEVGSTAPDGTTSFFSFPNFTSKKKEDVSKCNILMRTQVNHRRDDKVVYYDEVIVWVDLRGENVLRQMTRNSDGSVEILFAPVGEVASAGEKGMKLSTGAWMQCERRSSTDYPRPELKACVNPIFHSKDDAKRAEMARAFEALAHACAPLSDEQKYQLAKDQDRFDTAMAKNDCAVVSELEDAVKEQGAGLDCTLRAGLLKDTARGMYFAAVKLDTAQEFAGAKQLYLEIMGRFPDDDLAIQAASRLTQLNDMNMMATAQDENAKALADAQEELEAAAAAAKAETESLREQVEADRKASDARLRRAEQAAAEARQRANSQPRRNTACDHVSIGMYFEYNGGGFLGVANGRWEVIGINPQGGIVTARKTGQDFRRQISCYSVQ